MKQLFYMLLISVLTLSCTDNDETTNIKIINLSVPKADWIEVTDADKLNRYYYSSFNVPEITPWIYNNGVINAYIVLDAATQPLPYVRHFENLDGFKWTRTVDFEYESGKVRIFVTNDDFIPDLPQAMNFKVSIIW